MSRPNNRLVCSRCQEHIHRPSTDDSDNQTTMSTASESDDIHESDDEFIESDSDGWHSGEDYEESAAPSAGSSERWEEEEHNDHDDDDDDDDEEDGDELQPDRTPNGTPNGTPNNDLVNVSDVLDMTCQHESLMASLSAVLHSLEVSKDGIAGDGRRGRDGEAQRPQDADCSNRK